MAKRPSLLELLGQNVFDAFFNFEQPSQARAENEVGGGALANENELPELGGAEIDRLLEQALETFESESKLPVAEQQARRFAKPKTEEEVAKVRKASIPKNTAFAYGTSGRDRETARTRLRLSLKVW